ncbi:TrkH family potassium uptake protein [Paracoccus pacificus]|uniref:Trk system potassium uptake protein n=1 Tax=Paracoccus pacificus TaxID=1463598 RepID=A0ABW4R2I9_9RHOB
MIDLRPVVNVIGKLTIAMGATMVIPMAVDFTSGDPHWTVFLECAMLTVVIGALVTVATRCPNPSLDIRQTFLLTSGVWLVLPVIGALPLMWGAPGANFTDAYFEAMSGLTTTGTTALPNLDALPAGANLWRTLLQWQGGLGIVVVAMVFLPVMRVGGMQFFRSEGFDTQGKVLPRALDIAAEMTWFYVGMTAACTFALMFVGMSPYEALAHALSACSTGGFSTRDASYGAFLGAPEWITTFFSIMAALPFIRFIQLVRGDYTPLWRDRQVWAFLRWMSYAAGMIIIYRLFSNENVGLYDMIRETVFNVVTIFTGTGFASADVTTWGQFPMAVLFVAGLIGGCTGSTACSVKIFRYLVLFEAVRTQIRRMHSPHRVYPLQFDGRAISDDVTRSVMAFFTLFMLTFGLLIVALSLTGLHPRTALTGAWTAIANIGPVWGPEITANGSIAEFPVTAKWLMTLGMYLGRLELISVFVLLIPRFWRS